MKSHRRLCAKRSKILRFLIKVELMLSRPAAFWIAWWGIRSVRCCGAGSSAGSARGRVQSVALRLICEREDAIEKFVPEDYWIMGARVRKLLTPNYPFDVRLARIDDEKADVRDPKLEEEVRKDLEERKLKVANINTRTVNRKPMPPYITSTLQQAGSRFYGFSPSRTMRIAQSLYEGVTLDGAPVGLITYMRTDSVSLAKDAVEACRNFITENYGKKYVPEKPNAYKSRGSAQEAHEAIRPTDVTLTPERLKGVLNAEQLKLYRIIWQRFVGCQMPPAQVEQRTVEIEAVRPESGGKHSYLFRATASEVVFPGYMKVTHADKLAKEAQADEKKEDTDQVEKLPQLTEGEPLECLEWLSEAKQTQPPPRFSEAALVRVLEENGVGRPSTYAQILSTISTRKYVTREKRTLTPTELGRSVNTLLTTDLAQLFDVGFTASLEERLDSIEKGEVNWTDMLKDFYAKFSTWVEQAKGPPADPAAIATLLDQLETVKDWRPPQKQGRRTYDDRKFVESIREQLVEKTRDFSDRQLTALVRLMCTYRDQIPDHMSAFEKAGVLEEATGMLNDKPAEASNRKLELLSAVKTDEPVERNGRTYDDAAFIQSLKRRADSGRALTDAQRKALNRLVVKYSKQIPDFEAIRDELELQQEETEDNESGPLLEAMGHVKEWNEPVKRGKREFNDQTFFQSLSEQFEAKGALSVRQRAALKRQLKRYQSQIPGYEALAEKYEIKAGRSKKSSASDS